ncbi:hypothetical protein FB451DRAFT_1186890 [Mycena latifolia]|nr:hypothetical protein FB451DRAFT_1186890 [Mycena latifolia]
MASARRRTVTLWVRSCGVTRGALGQASGRGGSNGAMARWWGVINGLRMGRPSGPHHGRGERGLKGRDRDRSRGGELARATAVSAVWLDERQLRARGGAAGTGGGVAGIGTLIIASMGVESALRWSVVCARVIPERREGTTGASGEVGFDSSMPAINSHTHESHGLDPSSKTRIWGMCLKPHPNPEWNELAACITCTSAIGSCYVGSGLGFIQDQDIPSRVKVPETAQCEQSDASGIENTSNTAASSTKRKRGRAHAAIKFGPRPPPVPPVLILNQGVVQDIARCVGSLAV